jgi:pimeloyl-ACP methyl ester carboxylesterase
VVAPDLRGFGDAPAEPPLTLDRHADDVAALIGRLGARRAVVCGLSMGGYVALALWRRHPERVRALVLADTRAGADDEAQRARRVALAETARREGAAAVAASQLPGALGRTTREGDPARAEALRALMASASVEGIVGALDAMRTRPDSTALLPTIAVPTLVVVGAEDVLTPPKEARALAAAIPGARLVELAEAGHVSAWERPEAFTDALVGLLSGLHDHTRDL